MEPHSTLWDKIWDHVIDPDWRTWKNIYEDGDPWKFMCAWLHEHYACEVRSYNAEGFHIRFTSEEDLRAFELAWI